MKYTIEGDSLPVARIYLSNGEALISQAGGRTWEKGDVLTEVKSEGGAKKMFGRLVSGESLFLSKYTARGDCEIAFASSFAGSIIVKELAAGESIIAQKQAFMCATYGVDLSVYFNKRVGSGMFGGEGFIMQKVTGPGTVFLEINGYCVDYDLGPGERIVLDTGVLAFMDETCSMDVEVVKGGMKNVLFGGEGLMNTTVTGPGKVYLQSINLAALAQRLYRSMPSDK
ncbi:MAG: AIM24 family protein [Firmicutes bacterium]|nr:AIM24 family protein [Bacillota bacterium]